MTRREKSAIEFVTRKIAFIAKLFINITFLARVTHTWMHTQVCIASTDIFWYKWRLPCRAEIGERCQIYGVINRFSSGVPMWHELDFGVPFLQKWTTYLRRLRGVGYLRYQLWYPYFWVRGTSWGTPIDNAIINLFFAAKVWKSHPKANWFGVNIHFKRNGSFGPNVIRAQFFGPIFKKLTHVSTSFAASMAPKDPLGPL